MLGIALFGGLSATITHARDRVVRAEKQGAKDLATRLMGTVCGGGQPVVTTLGELADQGDQEGAVQVTTALRTKIVTAARIRIGHKPDENRVAFYELQDPDTLVYVLCEGRDQRPRRLEFTRSDTPLGRAMVEFAQGNGSPHQDYPDLMDKCPEGFGNPAEASYRSVLTTRVTAGPRCLGILCIDSPHPHNFNETARGVSLLLAGLLGAGLAVEQNRRGSQTSGVP